MSSSSAASSSSSSLRRSARPRRQPTLFAADDDLHDADLARAMRASLLSTSGDVAAAPATGASAAARPPITDTKGFGCVSCCPLPCNELGQYERAGWPAVFKRRDEALLEWLNGAAVSASALEWYHHPVVERRAVAMTAPALVPAVPAHVPVPAVPVPAVPVPAVPVPTVPVVAVPVPTVPVVAVPVPAVPVPATPVVEMPVPVPDVPVLAAPVPDVPVLAVPVPAAPVVPAVPAAAAAAPTPGDWRAFGAQLAAFVGDVVAFRDGRHALVRFCEQDAVRADHCAALALLDTALVEFVQQAALQDCAAFVPFAARFSRTSSFWRRSCSADCARCRA